MLELEAISFGYESAGTILFDDLTLRLAAGWTGIVGPNGSGKTTLLHLIAGRLEPRRGRIHGADHVVVCAQRTDDPPPGFADLLEDPAATARRLTARLGVEDNWIERWSTLSHGERKRAQIAAALRCDPAVLALDEPTNHVDGETRALVFEVLRNYRGVGLLVSHDRMLLDGLCGQCVFIEDGGVVMRAGNYTEASSQADQERDAAERAHEQAHKDRKRLRRTEAERRQEAARADSQRSKRKLGWKDHDAKSRIDAARVSGKDGQAGRLVRQMQGRMEQATDRLNVTRIARRRSLGMSMRGVPARSDAIWRANAHTISLGAGRSLALPELVVRPDDRIGVRGPNGAGKSTLVRHIMDELTLPAERVVYLPQEIDRAESRRVLGQLARLPSDRCGEVLAAIDCLGSDPERVLETDEPSPGEVRKLVLALGLACEPHFIVMDEPTNHLDLPSVECLEAALDECQCAMLLVSHDEAFLSRLARTWWSVGDARVSVGAA